MADKLKRYIRLVLLFNKYSIMRTMEHRVDFFLRIIPSTFSMFVTMSGLFVVFNHIPSIVGWTRDEMILLMGVFYVVAGLFFSMFIKNINHINRYVNNGSLDMVLLRPIDSLFTVSFLNGINWGASIDVLAGLLITSAAILRTDLSMDLSMGRVAGFVLMLINALSLSHSIWTMTMTSAFWLGRIRGFHEIFISLFQINKYPLGIFGDGLKRLLLSILPLGLMVYVPTKFLLGEFGFEWVVYSSILTLLFFAATRYLWRLGLKRYSGASS